jgi:hypothetical protein
MIIGVKIGYRLPESLTESEIEAIHALIGSGWHVEEVGQTVLGSYVVVNFRNLPDRDYTENVWEKIKECWGNYSKATRN